MLYARPRGGIADPMYGSQGSREQLRSLEWKKWGLVSLPLFSRQKNVKDSACIQGADSLYMAPEKDVPWPSSPLASVLLLDFLCCSADRSIVLGSPLPPRFLSRSLHAAIDSHVPSPLADLQQTIPEDLGRKT